jgi:hypothetical protein
MPDETIEQQLAAAKAKVDEFRQSNVELLKAAKQWEGLDATAAREALAKVAAGGSDDVVKLKIELAQSKSEAVAAQSAAAQAAFATTIGMEALRVGAIPEAVEVLVAKAGKVFAMKEGALTTEAFGAPGVKLTVQEWLQAQFKESAFCFKPSTGGGANHQKGRGDTSDGKTILRNPTSQQLGEQASAIKAGRVKVEYD